MRKLTLVIVLFASLFLSAQEIEGVFLESNQNLGGVVGEVTKTHPVSKNTVAYFGLNVEVHLTCPRKYVASTVLNETGEYYINALEPGKYYLRIRSLSIVKTFIVTPNRTTRLPTINVIAPLSPHFKP